MNLPGFTAQASLQGSSQPFRALAAARNRPSVPISTSIRPAQFDLMLVDEVGTPNESWVDEKANVSGDQCRAWARCCLKGSITCCALLDSRC